MDEPQRSSTAIRGEESTLAGNRRRTCLVSVLLLGVALTLSWILIEGPLTAYLRQSQLSASIGDLLGITTPEPNGEAPDPMAFLPPGTVLFDALSADLDGDGSSERVLVFNDEESPYESGMGGVVLVKEGAGSPPDAYEVRPSSEGKVTDAAIRDINADGVPELLIYKSSEDETSHFLHLYSWDGSQLVNLAPDGGTPDGGDAFASTYYTSEFKDLDMDGDDELLTYEDQPQYERLKVLVYVWNGEAFVHDDLYIVLGPPRPTSGNR
jgi:hypothetical protein